ncbi:MAG TPA: hypothetical protein VFB82_08480 [Blastocatellia bacterium]|nr:hypothetical protein [Blastocatellia bacterium]
MTSAKLRSILIGLFALSLGMLMALTTFAWLSRSPQIRSRIFEKSRLIRPEVVSIAGIERNGATLNLGQEFEGSTDWLKGSKFTLRNDSGKEIVHLAFELEFPETTSTGNVMIFPIWLGHRPGSMLFTKIDTLSLKPHQKVTLTIDEVTHDRLVKFIETRQPLSSISKVTLRVQFVAFEDGTGWSGGEYLRQDPKEPRRYIPVDK